MKNLLIFSLFLPLYLSAQSTYYTLPDSDAIWTLGDAYVNSPINTEFYVPPSYADTLVGSFTYRKVFVTSVGGSPFGNGYAGCYRSLPNGFTYYIPKDSTQELLLMDLSAQQGDTVFNVYYHDQGLLSPTVGNFKVVGTGLWLNGGYNLKYLGLQENLIGGYILYWIEGIGCRYGLNNQTQGGFSNWELYCMSAIDTTWFPNFIPNQTCQLDLGIDNQNSPPQIKVSPNPFTNEISINNFQSGSRIFLYDVFGRMIFASPISPTGSVEFASSLAAGIYLLEIKDEQGKRIGVEKVVKE